jgi:hypothetical protein
MADMSKFEPYFDRRERKCHEFLTEHWDEIKKRVVRLIRGPKVPCPCGHAHSRVMKEDEQIDLDDMILVAIHQQQTIVHMEKAERRKKQAALDEEDEALEWKMKCEVEQRRLASK